MKEEWKIYRKELLRRAKTVFLALGVSLLFYLFAIPNLQPNEHGPFILSCLIYGFLIYTWIWGLYGILWAIITKTKIKTGKEWKIGWNLHIPTSLLGMSIGLISAKWVVSYIFQEPFTLSNIWESLLIGVFISFMFQFYYAYKHSTQENLKLKAAKAESELHVLKNQMQPHFLFNSLNSLAELIDSNKDHASKMTQKLADLYREILENSKKQVSSLESEIAIIKNYLELEKLRFGDRLQYTISVPENLNTIYLPSLVLQTLVENAIKHGISKSIEGGDVEVQLLQNGTGYKVQITNSGYVTDNFKAENGTGFSNTKARLNLLYGDKHQFNFSTINHRTNVSFWFSGENYSG